MKKITLLSVLIILVITLQAVQAKGNVTSEEIEIVSEKTNIFINPLDTKKTSEKPVTSPSGIEITSTRKDPFQVPEFNPDNSLNTDTGEHTGEKPASDNRTHGAAEKIQEEISSVSAGNLFKYTGVLWNGSQYLAIITFNRKSYIVRKGDKLFEGYRVLYLDEKEIIVGKKGEKSSIKLQ